MTSARAAAFSALVALERGQSRRLAAALDRRGLGDRDRALALELAHGVERTRLLLDAVLRTVVHRELPRDPRMLVALRLGAYQLMRLRRVPPHAAVAETVGLLDHGRGLVNAVLRRLAGLVQDRAADPQRPRREIALDGDRALALETDALPDPRTEHAAHHALRHGLPAFLVERWEAQWGAAAAERLAAAADRVPAVTLVATGRARDAAGLRAVLAAEGCATEPLGHPRLLRWTEGSSPFAGEAFRTGQLVAQDPTAFGVVEAVGARPGETVVDLCAGPGTKTVLLAEAVAPGGVVHAYDVSEARRRPIRENARRLGCEAQVVVHDAPASLPPGDRVLADVPCSNTGVLARRVEVRRWLRPGDFAALAWRQQQLLGDALRRVRPGGRVVYSTCSIEPEENEGVLEAVLGEDGRIVRQERTFPDPPRHDGGFFAVIAAAGDGPPLL